MWSRRQGGERLPATRGCSRMCFDYSDNRIIRRISSCTKYRYHRWPGEGRGPLPAFQRVFVFCSLTSNRLIGDTYVRDVGGLVTGGSRAQVQVCLRKRNKTKITHARAYCTWPSLAAWCLHTYQEYNIFHKSVWGKQLSDRVQHEYAAIHPVWISFNVENS